MKDNTETLFAELYTIEIPLSKVVYFEEKIRARLIATLVIVFSLISSSAWTLWHGQLVGYFRYDVLLIPIISFLMKLVGAFILYYLTKRNCLILDLHSGKITTYYKFFFTIFVKNRFQIRHFAINPQNLMLSYRREKKLFVLYIKTTQGQELVLVKDRKESNIQNIMKTLREIAFSKEPAYEHV
jgi:hypothetical protein